MKDHIHTIRIFSGNLEKSDDLIRSCRHMIDMNHQESYPFMDRLSWQLHHNKCHHSNLYCK